jgi:hypothetical protein
MRFGGPVVPLVGTTMPAPSKGLARPGVDASNPMRTARPISPSSSKISIPAPPTSRTAASSCAFQSCRSAMTTLGFIFRTSAHMFITGWIGVTMTEVLRSAIRAACAATPDGRLRKMTAANPPPGSAWRSAA